MDGASPPRAYDLAALRSQLEGLRGVEPGPALARLVDAGLDRIPLPAQGNTLLRWQALALVAAHDLSLVKLFEGHTDALAILAELDAAGGSQDRWGTWAAEPPQARVHVSDSADGGIRISGNKAWCSGAASVTQGLLTAWRSGEPGKLGESGEPGEPGEPDRGPFLVAVEMRQPGVQVAAQGWNAVGMAGSASVGIRFDDAIAVPVGKLGDYLDRPGFWHGGAGIAACWYGAATSLADTLLKKLARGGDPHAAAHLGAVDIALQETAALLRQAAAWIDRNPAANAQLFAMRVRASAERSATCVLDHVGRALGAAPFCLDADFARRAADLPVYLRQSHAERDLQSLAEALAANPEPTSPWDL